MRWLFTDKKSPSSVPAAAVAASSRRKAAEGGVQNPGGSHSAKRKHERSARRELLYAVVREAMVRAGVLSASYKFKVLSLDGDGRQFLVMIDLARSAGADAANLTDIEALITQSAQSRHEIVVNGVYWRSNEHAAPGRHHAQASDSSPSPLESRPAPLHSASGPMVAPASHGPAYEPIQMDEVEAFKRALVAGSRPAPLTATPEEPKGRSAGAKTNPASRNYTLITGYEDTELPDPEQKTPILSGTQFGELR